MILYTTTGRELLGPQISSSILGMYLASSTQPLSYPCSNHIHQGFFWGANLDFSDWMWLNQGNLWDITELNVESQLFLLHQTQFQDILSSNIPEETFHQSLLQLVDICIESKWWITWFKRGGEGGSHIVEEVAGPGNGTRHISIHLRKTDLSQLGFHLSLNFIPASRHLRRLYKHKPWL